MLFSVLRVEYPDLGARISESEIANAIIKLLIRKGVIKAAFPHWSGEVGGEIDAKVLES